MGFLGNVIRAVIKTQSKKVAQYRDHPIAAQQKVFQRLIEVSKNTYWGKTHNFSQIKTQADFAKTPVNDYETIKDHVQRMLEGEQNIFWPTPIKWFAKSSGTTSDKSKFIPVSPEALAENHFMGGREVLAMYIESNPFTKIFDGKTLILGGSQTVHPLNHGARFGDISAVMLSNTPGLANYLRTPNASVSLMPEWEEKLQRTAEITIKQDIRAFTGVPTWNLVLIRKILEMTGRESIDQVWPNLELYIHGGVSFVPYETKFRNIIPKSSMNYYQTYNASEGFFAFQDMNDVDDMLLAIDHGIYYEFIPMEEWNKEQPETVTLADVELGKNYALLITTNAGLWRYKIGDTVIFTSKYPFRIKVSGRTKQFINAFGEEVMVDNSDQAIAKACKETRAEVSDYSVAPVYFSQEGKACHEWLIEFSKEPQDFAKFCTLLDASLKEINSDYEAKRYKDLALTPPLVKIASPDLFNKWLKSKGKLGGQHKIPRLSNDRKYMDELLAMM